MPDDIKIVGILTPTPKKLICDDEDEEFTGYEYFSCPTCNYYFGHADKVAKDMICPNCEQRLEW